ncbi:hypothetical protein CKO25_10370 [Thiocapsa imhoffii]|uniref:Uncharacterized protein n=1 Tax=Thiocapsa imhoffii TaxID=382777 RepID=A0A9X1B8L7_9GAMM|nr:hypothetical protein [Thiocapsa imhoffii]
MTPRVKHDADRLEMDRALLIGVGLFFDQAQLGTVQSRIILILIHTPCPDIDCELPIRLPIQSR